ncbi:Hypothetical predicted protein [Paramuricea clavata]|uniref:Uncharacterized protein n=1 Tax=Paramuricea clavata TaxID=317549 RepID=A0A7D9DGD7_PARCT|nr:Hypothetical predicted protein [Paramuricea clavata]
MSTCSSYSFKDASHYSIRNEFQPSSCSLVYEFKEAVKASIWNGIFPQWFVLKYDVPLNDEDSKLVSFLPVKNEEMESYFNMKFEDDTKIYSIAKPPSCALIDIVLAKGAPDTITESYYAIMRAQQAGGQLNQTLTRRTKLMWCLPSLKLCEEIICESAKLYVEGDDVGKHCSNIFTSALAKEYDVSEVVDCADSFLGHCPFLAYDSKKL